MKKTSLSCTALIAATFLFNLSSLQAQTATVSGMVTGVTSNQIQVKPASTANSLNIVFGSSTNLTDEMGNPIPVARIATGQQVMVYYDMQGNSMTANKIILKTVVGANTEGGATQKKALNMSNP